MGSTFEGAGGKAFADDINKRGYGMKGGKGRKKLSTYATLYSAQNHPYTPQSSFQNGGSGERIM
jgi:hypothetical protein